MEHRSQIQATLYFSSSTMVDFNQEYSCFNVFQFLIVSSLLVKQSFQMKEDVFRQADSRKEGDNKETVIHLEELSNIYSHTECTLRCQQHTAQRCKSIQFFEESNLCFLYEEKQKGDKFFNHFLPVDDCKSWLKRGMTKSGVYQIRMKEGHPLVSVWCDMTTDGGGWIVVQRRFDNSTNFNQNWEAYKWGFGNIHGEFWLGNQYLHWLTNRNETGMEIRIWGERKNGKTQVETDKEFVVQSEENKYRFTLQVGSTSTFGQNQQNRAFGAYDETGKVMCRKFGGGWWWADCGSMFLNGNMVDGQYKTGVRWVGLTENGRESIRKTLMMIR